MFWHIPNIPLAKGLSIGAMITITLWSILTFDMLGITETRNQLHGITHMSKVIWSHGVSRNKNGYIIIVWKLSNEL